MNKPKRIAITIGEPAGIGPDLIIQLAQQPFEGEMVVFGCPENLRYRAHKLGLPISLYDIDFNAPIQPNGNGKLAVYSVPLPKSQVMGIPHIANREAVLNSLSAAYSACFNAKCHALVTGPVHKASLNTPDQPFMGHTEFFADLAQTKSVMMAFYHPQCMLGLVTTHVPLREVSAQITNKRLIASIRLLESNLKSLFQIEKPKIGVLGLNPHAGESGQLGDEEIKVISPVIYHLKNQGLDLEGPLPGDSGFIAKNLEKYDALLAMYHDQGLAPIKAINFSDVVNVTLGLPIIRTSVDHGTAFDLAGTGEASPESLKAAINLAYRLIPSPSFSVTKNVSSF